MSRTRVSGLVTVRAGGRHWSPSCHSSTYQDSHFCSRDIPGASRSELDADCRRFVALYTRHTFAFATRAQHAVPPTLHLFVRVERPRSATTPLWETHDSPPHASRKRPSPWATVSFSSSSAASPLLATSCSNCYAVPRYACESFPVPDTSRTFDVSFSFFSILPNSRF